MLGREGGGACECMWGHVGTCGGVLGHVGSCVEMCVWRQEGARWSVPGSVNAHYAPTCPDMQ
eukprot:5455340-Alexandrium_andersonii.AAC.1